MEVCRVGGTPPSSRGQPIPKILPPPPVSPGQSFLALLPAPHQFPGGKQKCYLLPRSTRHFIHTYQHVIKNTDVRSMFSDEESLGAKWSSIRKTCKPRPRIYWSHRSSWFILWRVQFHIRILQLWYPARPRLLHPDL